MGFIPQDNMILNILLLVVGFVILIKGADFFVDGSSGIARIFGVPGVIIGLTIVAMGTSAPELAVSVSAALSGSNEIAVSNVVGSNIFNILMVLGVCAIMKPLPVDIKIKNRDYPISIAATVLVLVFAGLYKIIHLFSPDSVIPYDNYKEAYAGEILRIGGIIFLLCFVAYMLYTIKVAKKTSDDTKDSKGEDDKKKISVWFCIILIIVGITGIILGGEAVVTTAKNLALMWGMSETLVGLTIVAVGTSLPELVTSIVASTKGENGMAIGNVVGSNIFNLLLILGASASITPITITRESFYDVALLLLISVIAYIFISTKDKISRYEGILMVFIYIAYTAYAIIR